MAYKYVHVTYENRRLEAWQQHRLDMFTAALDALGEDREAVMTFIEKMEKGGEKGPTDGVDDFVRTIERLELPQQFELISRACKANYAVMLTRPVMGWAQTNSRWMAAYTRDHGL